MFICYGIMISYGDELVIIVSDQHHLFDFYFCSVTAVCMTGIAGAWNMRKDKFTVSLRLEFTFYLVTVS